MHLTFEEEVEQRYYAKRLLLVPALRKRSYQGHKPVDAPHIVWYAKFADLLSPEHLGHLENLNALL